MTNLMAGRLRELPPYLFARIDRMKSEALSRGMDVIDLGVGDPRRSDPPEDRRSPRRGGPGGGSAPLFVLQRHPEAPGGLFRMVRDRFRVELDPDGRSSRSGSKEGIGHICFALLIPGTRSWSRIRGIPSTPPGRRWPGPCRGTSPFTRKTGFSGRGIPAEARDGKDEDAVAQLSVQSHGGGSKGRGL
jgi:LL-diaminopimelate aminotransferase